MCTSRHSKTFACVLVGTCGMFLSAGPAVGHVIVDEPNGGEFLEVGSVVTIEWHIAIVHNLLNWDLWYSTTGAAGPYIPIEMDLPPGSPALGSMHTYEWTVPDDPSDQVRVRVRMDNSGTDYFDISDANLTIGAPKVCNDVDNDGYGSPGDPSCPNGAAGDCDDGDPDINPGAAEVCNDFVDNDCDELTDGDDPDCGGPTTHHVVQVALTFVPADIVVLAGDTIEWHWADGIHTVTSGSSCTPDGRFDDPFDVANQVVTYTVPLNEPGGVIPYYCIPHCLVNMIGTITVLEPPIRAPAPHDILKNRYISIDPRGVSGNNPASHHIRVMLDSSLVNGQVGTGPWWATEPVSAPVGGEDCISLLANDKPAVEPDWSGCPIVHLTGCQIIPTTTYAIAAESGGTMSADALLDTQAKPGARWHGDCVGFFTGTEWTAPNGETNIADAVAAIKTFQNPNNTPGCGTPPCNATHVSVTDVAPNLTGGGQINLTINIEDVFIIILGFQGQEYPGTDLTKCQEDHE